jgi:hypothetical protein
MAWSNAIDAIITGADVIRRSIIFEFQNGYSDTTGAAWETVLIEQSGWSKSKTENVLSIESLRLKVVHDDFGYYDEFDHANPVQLSAECRVLCTIYLDTTTPLTGTVTLDEHSRIIQGLGTLFLTELQVGDLVNVPAAGITLMVEAVIDDLSFRSFRLPTVSIIGVAAEVQDAEREYIFRGTVEDAQEQDLELIIECFDPIDRFNTSLADIDSEADILGPYADAELRQAPGYDTAPDIFHFEIDPTVPGQDWAENGAGLNRAFQPGVFVIERWTGGAWVEEPADLYMIDEGLGLVIYNNDQGPVAPSLRIQSVAVYLEGTLELETVLEAIITYPNAWPFLGPGFDADQLRIYLTGTITFVAGGPPYNVTGVGTNFQADLRVGERIALSADASNYGIIATIDPVLQELTLLYEYPGTPGANGAYFKSTLRASGVSLSKLVWTSCDGSAADLIRVLQTNYADARGYRIWYDPMTDLVMGRSVAIDPANAIVLGPIGNLRNLRTMENFYSAINVRGQLGKAENLVTKGGVTVTALATGLAPPWSYGIPPSTETSYNGMTWALADPPALGYLIDADPDTACLFTRNGTVADESLYFDYVRIDLGAEYDLGSIFIYAINCKNSNQWKQGVTLLGALVVGGPYTPLSPETYQAELTPNETREFDCTGTRARYILIRLKPFKWVASGVEKTMGLREIIVFGTTNFCYSVAIQNVVDPGAPPYTEGQGGHFIGGSTDDDDFIIDYYPDLVAKLGRRGHRTLNDDGGTSLSEANAKDRAYILLNEYIRLYREITWEGAFDPRVQIYHTAEVLDDYRNGPPETLTFLVETVSMNEGKTVISGREYGAGVLE